MPSRFRASRLYRAVRRLVSSARFARPSRMGAVSFCCSLVLVSFIVAVLSCVPVPSRFALASRLLIVPSLRPRLVARLVSSSRRLVPVLMPVPMLCAVPSCSSLVPVRYPFRVLLFLSPSWGGAVVSWPWGGGGLLLSSHQSQSFAHTRSFIRSLWDGYGGVDMGRRSMLLVAHPLPVHAVSFLPSHRFIALIAFSSSHPLKPENDEGNGESGLERDARTRRIEQDARRDEGVGQG